MPRLKNVAWCLSDAFYGNEELDRKPSNEFISEVAKYDGLKESMLSIEGLISGRGQHASAVVIYPTEFVNYNAMMKTSSGLEVTQFCDVDTENMGGLKLDFLSISSLDKIRAAMDLLLEKGKIKWQGSLRETYNKYFHPDVLELEAKEMFELLYQGEVMNAFQFETSVGSQALRKIQPMDFQEICACNSLMRLSNDGEQPLDKYLRFKLNPQDWLNEMIEHGLNEKEINILKSHLDVRRGLCDTQELLMSLSMDKNIAGIGLTSANRLRKSIVRHHDDVVEKHRLELFEAGLANGNRIELLEYVWEILFKPQFG